MPSNNPGLILMPAIGAALVAFLVVSIEKQIETIAAVYMLL